MRELMNGIQISELVYGSPTKHQYDSMLNQGPLLKKVLENTDTIKLFFDKKYPSNISPEVRIELKELQKLTKNIDSRGSKSKSPFKSRYKNELIKFKKFSYYKKLHYGEPINKGKRISIIIYTISNDILKTTSTYKKYHKYILNL